MNPLDFKAEAITFKATANGILFSLANCLDLLSRSEEHWRKRLEKEQVARKRAEEKFRRAVSNIVLKCFKFVRKTISRPPSRLCKNLIFIFVFLD